VSPSAEAPWCSRWPAVRKLRAPAIDRAWVLYPKIDKV
jgi:hypothetical protein